MNGIIKVSGLNQKRAKQKNPRLTWMIPQKIYLMYSDIRNKEERGYVMLLKSMPEHKQSNTVKQKLEESWDKTEKINIYCKG